MTEQAQEQTPPTGDGPTLAERLGQSYVQVRRDLTAARHVFRGEVTYVIRDALAMQTHRIDHASYRVLIRIRRTETLAEIFDGVVADGLLEREDEERFYRFVLSLHGRGFLQLPIVEGGRLYERNRKLQEARASQRWMSPFFFRVSLFNPDSFLSRTAHRARPFFTRPAYAVWMLTVLAGLVVAIRNARDLAQPLSQVLVADNLPLLWLTLVTLKVLHELGHAYACKLLGGNVPEIGVHFIAGTPLPYVDASAAWGFPRKRDRLLVSLGGMYVELFLAAVAILVWATADPGIVKASAYNVALLASVVTVAFNLNPLMKFDGYFVLSDLVEVPNLRERATGHVVSVLKRRIFGIPSREFEGTRRAKVSLFCFGVACAVYRPFVILGIATVIASRYFMLGVALASVYALVEGGRVVTRLARFLFLSPETANLRPRAVLTGALVFLFLPAGICLIPLPARIVAPGIVSSLDETVVRAQAPGFVSVIRARVSEAVEENAPLVDLVHSRDEAALQDARGRLEEALLRAESLRYRDRTTADLERRRAEHIAREVAWYERENERRRVRAPRSGRLVSLFVDRDHGRYVESGEPLAVLNAGSPVARVLLTEQAMSETEPAPGQEVLFRAAARPEQTIAGHIVSVQPAGSRLIEEVQLTHLAGGSIPVDPLSGAALQPYFEVVVRLPEDDAEDLPHGATGNALMDASRESLGRIGLRRVLRFLQELKRGG